MKNLLLSILVVCVIGVMIPSAFATIEDQPISVTEDAMEEVSDSDTALGMIFIIVLPITIVILVVIFIKKMRQKNKEIKTADIRINKQKKHLSKMEQSNYVQKAGEDSLFCDSCGTKLNPTSEFCSKCGTKI